MITASIRPYEPTIFDNVDKNTTIAQEEIFGPVTTILDFQTDEEALDIINCSEYGLASGIFTTNDVKAKWIADTANSPAQQSGAFNPDDLWKQHLTNQQWRKDQGRSFTHGEYL